jgi:hypothetical protein
LFPGWEVVVRSTFIDVVVKVPTARRRAMSMCIIGDTVVEPFDVSLAAIQKSVEKGLGQLAPKTWGPEIDVEHSVGSSKHHEGKCKPCAFYHKPRGCESGLSCTFCHICPPGEKKRRVQARRKAHVAPACEVRSQLSSGEVSEKNEEDTSTQEGSRKLLGQSEFNILHEDRHPETVSATLSPKFEIGRAQTSDCCFWEANLLGAVLVV